MTEDTTSTQSTPVIRVEYGCPTEEELAALTVVIMALVNGAPQESPLARRGWSHRARTFNMGAVRGVGWGGTS
ncbi:acyl-CoA carboxylase subunit epsilon [Austwickia chelonae]|uniref:acyl-CoA carboxylase subunit epsilon n=1 Tax=Austwickia chelonae TaxID=100225 RepID=UPI000E22773E|nr:acyl-CoA carboxylase subunit epsilon [Austwickia chelonae]